MNDIYKLGVGIPEFYLPKGKTVDERIQNPGIKQDEEIFDPKTDEDFPTTNEASIDELATEGEGEIDDFTCAILQEKIQTPGILSCGHFFELQQIDAFRQFQLQKNLPFACPKGCRNVQNKVIESKQLRNGIEESSKKIATLRNQNAILKSSNSNHELRILKLESEILDMQSKLESRFKKLLENSVVFSDTSRKILENSQKISKISSKISEQNDLLREKNKIRKKQIKNAKPETLMGRVYLCIWPDSALNNGISPNEKEILKKKGLSAEQMEKLNMELDNLDCEMEKLIFNAENLEEGLENSNQ